MSETIIAGVVGAAITGACGISLFLVKKLVNCLCPGRCQINCHCGFPMPQNAPIRTLNVKYEEPKNDAQNGKRSAHMWNIKISQDLHETEKRVHLFKEIKNVPDSGHYFFRVYLTNISHQERAYIFVRRFTGPANDWTFSKTHGNFRQEAFEGLNKIYLPSLINEGDVTKEQVGIMFLGKGGETVTSTVSEAYYGEFPTSLYSSFCKKCTCLYRCFESKNTDTEKEEY